MSMRPKTVALLLFPDVEVLDFAGPFEVFSRTRLVPGADSRRSDDSAPFTTFTVARHGDAVTGVGRGRPDYDGVAIAVGKRPLPPEKDAARLGAPQEVSRQPAGSRSAGPSRAPMEALAFACGGKKRMARPSPPPNAAVSEPG